VKHPDSGLGNARPGGEGDQAATNFLLEPEPRPAPRLL